MQHQFFHLVQENPAGCTRDEGRRVLKAGKELITYRSYTTEPPFRFTGCERGHLGTAPAANRAGDPVGLLDVDSWDIFIRFDQETDIQDEVGRRIGEIVNETGPYDMVYFDGSEDVDRRRYHYFGPVIPTHGVQRNLDNLAHLDRSDQFNVSWQRLSGQLMAPEYRGHKGDS